MLLFAESVRGREGRGARALLAVQPCFFKRGGLSDLKIAVLLEVAGRRHIGVKLNKHRAARVSIPHEKTLGEFSAS